MTRNFPPADERGMALPLAVFSLVVIGALVAGIFFTGRIEQRTGTNGAMAAQAFETAEAGVALQMVNWQHNDLDVGETEVVNRTSVGAKSAYRATVERLSPNTFMLQVDGEQFSSTVLNDANLLATRRVARLLKLQPVHMTVQAALLARGNVQVRGTANLDGNDTNPPTWTGCDPSVDPVSGIRTSGDVTFSGTPDIDGDPPVEEFYPGLSDSTFMRPFNELKGAADIKFNGGTMSPYPVVYVSAPTVCNTSPITNWGEPLGGLGAGIVDACQTHFPIIYSRGNLRLSNGRGQGILLVEGDLTLAGNFEFNGIVIATGTFDASHGTNIVHGAVLSSNAQLDDMTLAGTPTVNYSACAVQRALSGGAHVSPMAGRGWVQIY